MSNENKKRYEQFVKIFNKEFGEIPSPKTVRRQYKKAKNEEQYLLIVRCIFSIFSLCFKFLVASIFLCYSLGDEGILRMQIYLVLW